ncbi:DUF2076 domain-containing protein [Buchnera aphidicola]|uniref:DUF2076 domain-containing protein n=1 Tax=Buchnera aphidicola TaxID=9 RepID=UPI00223812C3|nr:DUF2076 domain-containing protein [Buchnera aphidicola]MCW5197739.1 DUF2076 domain-containing protein [Buchnera aphidicola (Chaitophorus viminalis)]
MQTQEKKLIQDLFKKLNLAEKNSSSKDLEAENFIKKNLEKQPNSIYYLIQTILVQEVAIKKLNNIIKKLEDKLKNSSSSVIPKKSFLSDLINRYIPNKSSKDTNFSSNTRKNNSYYNTNERPLNQSNENINTSSIPGSGSSFLTNALQTAVGVTGGIVAGNMLLNLFDHNKPEEDILNHSNENFISNEEYENQYNNVNNFDSFEYPNNNDNLSQDLENSSEYDRTNQDLKDSDISNNNESTTDFNDSRNFLDTNDFSQDDAYNFDNRNINTQESFDNEDMLDEDYDTE